MESIAALSLASNIIQVVEFSSRIISRGYELYQSADGRREEHVILDNAVKNLSALHSTLQNSGRSRSEDKLSMADKQLIKLQIESGMVAKELRELLQKVQLKKPNGKWQSVRQALLSVFSDKEISSLGSRLDNIRKQVDSAILVSLRETVNDVANGRTAYGRPHHSDNTEDRELAKRHGELLDAIRAHDWMPSERHDLRAFSEQLDIHQSAVLQSRFKKMILARLYFPHLPDRVESIPKAHAKTFDWLFDDGAQVHWDSFSKWLQEDDARIYWVAGKPGSGKSTLMKYLYHHQQLADRLQLWSGATKLTRAGFYLWNSGSEMQMSRCGMLQALLHACFSENEELVQSAWIERWEQFLAFGGGQGPFEWSELLRAFDRVVSDHQKKFFFLIDGMDEFHGESKDIIDFVLRAAQPNVKLCVASRPWIPFEDAFGNRPSLRLERLTQKDIASYVDDHLKQNVHYNRLVDCEPQAAESLVPEIIEKAAGVFLWVYLVVQSLLEGLSHADRASDLHARLQSLPSELEDLFNLILDRLHPTYFKQACESFRLIRSYREATLFATGDLQTGGNPTLLGLYFADEADTKTSLSVAQKPLSDTEARKRAEQMSRRLNARCKGLLELPMTRTHNPATIWYDQPVSYLHRTARDYVESESYWQIVQKATGGVSFCPEKRWANANLWLHKVHPLVTTSYDHSQYMQNRCLDSAIAIYQETATIQTSYLNEVFRYRSLLQSPSGTSIENWAAHLRTQYSLLDYLAILLMQASSTDRSAALKIAKTVLARCEPSDTQDLKKMKALRNVRKAFDCQTAPSSMRLLLRKPKLPRYE